MRGCWCAQPTQEIASRFTSEKFEVAYCGSCGSYSIDRHAADPAEDSERYLVANPEHRAIQLAHAAGILDRIERHSPPPGRLLDIGSSSGALLQVAAERGYEPVGIEMEARLVEASRAHGCWEVISEPVEQARLSGGAFDVVTISHLLEHIEQPLAFMRVVARVLKAGGTVYVELPNADCGMGRHFYRSRWQGIWAPGHFWVFSPGSIRVIAGQVGLEPLVFDSWSVPLLTGGPRGWIKKALYWLSDRLTGGEFLGAILRKPSGVTRDCPDDRLAPDAVAPSSEDDAAQNR